MTITVAYAYFLLRKVILAKNKRRLQMRFERMENDRREAGEDPRQRKECRCNGETHWERS